jgi:hypothetical protein
MPLYHCARPALRGNDDFSDGGNYFGLALLSNQRFLFYMIFDRTTVYNSFGSPMCQKRRSGTFPCTTQSGCERKRHLLRDLYCKSPISVQMEKFSIVLGKRSKP